MTLDNSVTVDGSRLFTTGLKLVMNGRDRTYTYISCHRANKMSWRYLLYVGIHIYIYIY